ncbi:MAG: helix-turn-helix domain-containing protein [Prevotella sp.]|nr:helix-turn-helix domain-containing protein [Prevotella sp.]
MPPPPEDGPLAGLTPAAYIQRIKIKNAKTLFDNNPQMSVKCAFNDYSNFVRAFKNIMGITPTEYRRRYTQ